MCHMFAQSKALQPWRCGSVHVIQGAVYLLTFKSNIDQHPYTTHAFSLQLNEQLYPTYGTLVPHSTRHQSHESWETSLKKKKAQHLIRSVSPNAATSVPSQPFPVLKLPREIRNSIYYHALLRPRNGPSVNPTYICYFHPKVPADSASKSCWTPYWGTKEFTRLVLVNRQISNEALELFYSAFPFHFPQSVDVALVNATLRDTLSPWARSLITRIGFMFGLFLYPWSLSPSVTRRRQDRRSRLVGGPVCRMSSGSY